MNKDILSLKQTWQSLEMDPNESFNEFNQTLQHWRKKKRRIVILWSAAVILFSGICFVYVVYTDELNSIYKSISEIILLLISFYLFGYSWRRITREQKEYLSNSTDFIQTLPDIHMKQGKRDLMMFCILTTFLLIAVFLYFLDSMLHFPVRVILSSALLLILTGILWTILKPIFWKRIKTKNQRLSSKIAEILQYD
ncbi:hypothetical protein [Chryseobacterium contaminans]|uniref:hypothetical protein n=1 Tax=Chryseobacterium contaminans TaxID=1423959 RepID=UPI00301A7DD1